MRKLIKNGPIPASFCLFPSFSSYNFNNTNWKIVDGVLGIQTRGRRMVGTDETMELWQLAHLGNKTFLNDYFSVPWERRQALYRTRQYCKKHCKKHCKKYCKMWRVNFTRQQWLVTFTFVIVNFCNAMCVSMQVCPTSVHVFLSIMFFRLCNSNS